MEEQQKLSISHVFKWYDKTQVLNDINLDVRAGEFLCIVGPSGCGKTTLLRMAAGLIPIDYGQVKIDGEVMAGASPKIAMVFQHFGLFPWKTVFRNVAFPLDLKKVPRADIDRRVMWALELVGLSGTEHRFPGQLSGGMRQRVGLARALAAEPQVLLMDEPFASVDAQVREILQEELLNIWSKFQQTVVFITHSIDEAVTLGDRVVVMGTKPGAILAELSIDIERPRTIASVRRHPSYMNLRENIWALLKQAQQEAMV